MSALHRMVQFLVSQIAGLQHEARCGVYGETRDVESGIGWGLGVSNRSVSEDLFCKSISPRVPGRDSIA